MRLPAFGVLVVFFATSGFAEDSSPVPLYDPDPQHLWNRLHAAMWDRVGPGGKIYGHDRIDPVRWQETVHLLDVPSREAFAQVLQEFLNNRGETLIEDPLKRAMLQRDLWAIFDWLVGEHDVHPIRIADDAKAALREPLAQMIGRLALDADEIAKLPDTYAAAVAGNEFPANFDPAKPETSFLPPNLFDPLGSWVCVARNGTNIIAPVHLEHSSRSSFQVFLRFPAGRTETANYIAELSSFKEPFVMIIRSSDGRFVPQPNQNLPQFPAGTQVAFVRSALLIDSAQKLLATRIVESVQLRVYNEILSSAGNYEFVLNRARLFARKSGGLRAIDIDERDFRTDFRAHQFDVLEEQSAADKDFAARLGIVRRRCVGCHNDRGVHSFRTFVGGIRFTPSFSIPALSDTDTLKRGETAAISYKKTRYDWGLLEGLLSKANVTP